MHKSALQHSNRHKCYKGLKSILYLFQIAFITLISEYPKPEFEIDNDIVIDISNIKGTILCPFQIAFITLCQSISSQSLRLIMT